MACCQLLFSTPHLISVCTQHMYTAHVHTHAQTKNTQANAQPDTHMQQGAYNHPELLMAKCLIPFFFF